MPISFMPSWRCKGTFAEDLLHRDSCLPAGVEARERLRALGAADVHLLDDEERAPQEMCRAINSFISADFRVGLASTLVARRAQAIACHQPTPSPRGSSTMRIDLKWRYSSSNIVSAVPAAS